jgi:hypothetical protein
MVFVIGIVIGIVSLVINMNTLSNMAPKWEFRSLVLHVFDILNIRNSIIQLFIYCKSIYEYTNTNTSTTTI